MKWSGKYANPSGHNTAHSKCNFKNFFEPLWAARSLANKLRVHVNHVGSQLGSQRLGNTKTLVLHDSLKLSSFIEITHHPQICCFWCRWVALADLYKCSSLNFPRTIRQMPSNSDCKKVEDNICPPCHFGVESMQKYHPNQDMLSQTQRYDKKV